eukprot:m.20186 g.20186  ORF g.20186 m.20186 type:complete len:809 (+) comp12421_c1_seq1:172-2598(+)
MAGMSALVCCLLAFSCVITAQNSTNNDTTPNTPNPGATSTTALLTPTTTPLSIGGDSHIVIFHFPREYSQLSNITSARLGVLAALEEAQLLTTTHITSWLRNAGVVEFQLVANDGRNLSRIAQAVNAGQVTVSEQSLGVAFQNPSFVFYVDPEPLELTDAREFTIRSQVSTFLTARSVTIFADESMGNVVKFTAYGTQQRLDTVANNLDSLELRLTDGDSVVAADVFAANETVFWLDMNATEPLVSTLSLNEELERKLSDVGVEVNSAFFVMQIAQVRRTKVTVIAVGSELALVDAAVASGQVQVQVDRGSSSGVTIKATQEFPVFDGNNKVAYIFEADFAATFGSATLVAAFRRDITNAYEELGVDINTLSPPEIREGSVAVVTVGEVEEEVAVIYQAIADGDFEVVFDGTTFVARLSDPPPSSGDDDITMLIFVCILLFLFVLACCIGCWDLQRTWIVSYGYRQHYVAHRRVQKNRRTRTVIEESPPPEYEYTARPVHGYAPPAKPTRSYDVYSIDSFYDSDGNNSYCSRCGSDSHSFFTHDSYARDRDYRDRDPDRQRHSRGNRAPLPPPIPPRQAQPQPQPIVVYNAQSGAPPLRNYYPSLVPQQTLPPTSAVTIAPQYLGTAAYPRRAPPPATSTALVPLPQQQQPFERQYPREWWLSLNGTLRGQALPPQPPPQPRLHQMQPQQQHIPTAAHFARIHDNPSYEHDPPMRNYYPDYPTEPRQQPRPLGLGPHATVQQNPKYGDDRGAPLPVARPAYSHVSSGVRRERDGRFADEPARYRNPPRRQHQDTRVYSNSNYDWDHTL